MACLVSAPRMPQHIRAPVHLSIFFERGFSTARLVLDAVCPKVGLIFGKHNYRLFLRAAARAAGIGPDRADRISDYDFRHSRLTYLAEQAGVGLIQFCGHQTGGRYGVQDVKNETAA